MKIVITGANGTLGQDIIKQFSAGNEIVATDRDILDITNRDAVFEFIQKEKPWAVINTAAYNLVDKVEEPDIYTLAHKINALGPKYLAEATKSINAKFVHFSTDYVFAGDKPDGYTEESEPSPISAYGKTKADGERLILEAGGYNYICRLSKIFGKPGISEASKESFAHLMLCLAKEKPELSIVDEEVGCPSYTQDIAASVRRMLQLDMIPGIYHIVNEGVGVTWYEFAKEIFELANVEIKVSPVSSDEFPKPAKRPKFAELKNTKLQPLRSRRDALFAFLIAEGLTNFKTE